MQEAEEAQAEDFGLQRGEARTRIDNQSWINLIYFLCRLFQALAHVCSY